MTKTARTCVFFAAIAMLSACSHKKSQAEQLADLDKSFQGGTVTRQEYDLKKASITGQPAPAAIAPVAPATPAPAPAPATATSKATGAAAGSDEPAPVKACEEAENHERSDAGLLSRFYPLPEPQVKKAALDALQILDFTVHGEAGNEIDATRKRTKKGAIVGAGGERVTLRIEAITQDGKAGTMVTGATAIPKTGVFAGKSWTGAVLAQIACNLK